MTKTNQIKHNGIIEKLLLEKANKANRDMNTNLLALSETECSKYMNLNDNVIKNMMRLHGTVNLNNVFTVKRQHFSEKVLHDHLYKKNKIGEFIRSMFYHEDIIRFYQEMIGEAEDNNKAVYTILIYIIL